MAKNPGLMSAANDPKNDMSLAAKPKKMLSVLSVQLEIAKITPHVGIQRICDVTTS